MKKIQGLFFFIIGLSLILSANTACKKSEGQENSDAKMAIPVGEKKAESGEKSEGQKGEQKKGEGEKSFFKHIPVEEAYKLWKSKKVEVIDVRTPGEYAQGHIPGAKLHNLLDPKFRSGISKLDRDKTYLVYCRSGNRSAAAMNIMKELNFKRVYNMKGGMIDWNAKKYPVEK